MHTAPPGQAIGSPGLIDDVGKVEAAEAHEKELAAADEAAAARAAESAALISRDQGTDDDPEVDR
jgi:hypothetical protein